MYPSLFGTPAAETARNAAIKIQDITMPVFGMDETIPPELQTGLMPVYDDNMEQIGTRITLPSGTRVSEELMKRSNIDEFINDSLETLRQGIRDNVYPEGTVQRTMVDFMIDGLEGIRRREMIYGQTMSAEGLDYPGVDITNKVANYVFIPMLAERRETVENGQTKEELIFPEGFAEDDPWHWVQPRKDIQDKGRYSNQELQESADRVNFGGFSQAGLDYSRNLRQVQNLIGIKPPANQEEDRILRENLLASIQAAKQELTKAMQVPVDDPVALRMFGDLSDQMADVINTDRGFRRNLEELNKYEEYLRSGLPISGYSEYDSLKTYADKMAEAAPLLEEHLVNGKAYADACRDFAQAVNNRPANSDPESVREWKNSVKEKMQQCSEEFKRLSNEPHYVEKTWPPLPEESDPVKRKAQEEQREKEIRAWNYGENQVKADIATGIHSDGVRRIDNSFLNRIDRFGANSYQQKNDYITNMTANLIKVQQSTTDELRALRESEKDISRELSGAMDRAIRLGDPGKSSPKEFTDALNEIKRAAEQSGNKKLSSWAKSNAAYFGNRVLEAESKGLSADIALGLQQKAAMPGHRAHIDEALAMFNTKRSRIFGKGDGTHGKETEEHRALRVAAENLVRARNELAHIQDRGSSAYYAKAQEVLTLSEQVNTLGTAYLGSKKRAIATPVGRERRDGAMFLCREAELLGVTMKKELQVQARYQEIARETQRLRQKDQLARQQDEAQSTEQAQAAAAPSLQSQPPQAAAVASGKEQGQPQRKEPEKAGESPEKLEKQAEKKGAVVTRSMDELMKKLGMSDPAAKHRERRAFSFSQNLDKEHRSSREHEAGRPRRNSL